MIGTQASVGVLVWWTTLAYLGALGCGLWLLEALRFRERRHQMHDLLLRARARQLVLSGLYAFGCAFRAALPRADVQRICLYDSWLSSVLVGRSVATVAELSFALQWALMLRELGENEGATLAAITSRAVVPLIVIAEICSWYAVITTNFLGNAIEQSLWNLSVALMTVSLVTIIPRCPAAARKTLSLWAMCGVGFVLFVSTIDVPMYVSRFVSDQRAAKSYLSLGEGLRDLASRWVVTHAWEPWRDEVAWMTLYFSFAVWLSISLVRVPWLGRATSE